MTELRIATEADLPAVLELVNRVFRQGPDMDPTLGEELPVLFDAANVGNLHVAVEDGRIVSHVGLYHQTIVTGGCRLPVASLGAVATHPDFRGRGLAGRLVDHAIAAARDACDVLMHISGDRILYTGRGAVGVDTGLTAKADSTQLKALRRQEANWQVLRFVPADHLTAVARLHEREAIRYAWPADPTRKTLDGMLANGAAGLIAVDAAGELHGWICYRFAGPMHTDGPGHVRVLDLCGDRRAVGHLCSAVGDFHEVTAMTLLGTMTDRALADTLTAAGIAHKPRALTGTVRVLDAGRLFALCGPLMAERLTRGELAALSVADDGAAVTFTFAEQSWRVEDRSLVGQICLDPRQGWIGKCPQGAHRVADVLLRALPVDMPDYGVCYL
jgi:predicted N-acetyltransferase YhbS